MLDKRLSALTNGMVTIKVGGATPIEVQERIFRYEDAINALRAAIKDGYLVGGGLAILGALKGLTYDEQLAPMFKKYCEASIRQIAENCGEYPQHIITNLDIAGNIGYNAKNGEFENLIDVGVIDPYKVTQMAIENSISVAIALLTSKWILVNDNRKDNDTK